VIVISAINTLWMLVPIISYVALMVAVKTGRLAQIYLFLTVTVATVILGVVSISMIAPLNADASSLRDWTRNIIVAVYVGAMLYGAIGTKSNNLERVLVGGLFVALVSLVSAVI
jgi:hypothetical protein